MGKSIFGALAVLIVLGLVWALYKPKDSTLPSGPSQALAAFKQIPFKDAAKITLRKGQKSAEVELKKAGDKWVVASSFGYPADGEKVDKILKILGEIKDAEPRGEEPSQHTEFDVDDKKGVILKLFSQDGKELTKLVIGKHATSKSFSTTAAYVRFGDDPTTYEVVSTIRNETAAYGDAVEGKAFLKKKIFSIPDDSDVESVRLTRPDKPDLLVERRFKEVPVEKPKDAVEPEKKEGTPDAAKEKEKEAEKKPETKKEEYFVVTSGSDTKDVEKSEEYQARGFLNRGKDFSIEDAVEPKDLKEYGLDKPQLKATVSYRKKEAPDAELKTFVVLYGNAKKDEKGENKGYYAAIESDEQKGRIYLVQTWTFDSTNKEMKDFLPKPKEEPKPTTPPANPTDATKTDTGAAPQPVLPVNPPVSPPPGTLAPPAQPGTVQLPVTPPPPPVTPQAAPPGGVSGTVTTPAPAPPAPATPAPATPSPAPPEKPKDPPAAK